MGWDSEMERALIADGEKLRALTGEDHGPWFDGDDELPPTFAPEEPAEVAELREQLATARAALERLSTYEAFTTEGWGFAHPEITARVNFARAALKDQP